VPQSRNIVLHKIYLAWIAENTSNIMYIIQQVTKLFGILYRLVIGLQNGSNMYINILRKNLAFKGKKQVALI
jgi:hypothetical protein